MDREIKKSLLEDALHRIENDEELNVMDVTFAAVPEGFAIKVNNNPVMEEFLVSKCGEEIRTDLRAAMGSLTNTLFDLSRTIHRKMREHSEQAKGETDGTLN